MRHLHTSVRSLLAAGLSVGLAAGPAFSQQSVSAAGNAAVGGVSGAAGAVAGAVSLSGGAATLAPVRLVAPAVTPAATVTRAPAGAPPSAVSATVAPALGARTLSAVSLAGAAGAATLSVAPASRVPGPGPVEPAGTGASDRKVTGGASRSKAAQQLGDAKKAWEKKDGEHEAVDGSMGEAGAPKGVAATLRRAISRILGWNFDWDDNIFYMPTKIVLFNTKTGEEKLVTTEEYAHIRQKVEKGEGEWAGYKTDDDPKTGSFRYFLDAGGKNYFLEDIKAALEGKKAAWQGPSWDAFVFALSRPETAARTTIITARGHSAENMLEGLRYLQSRGHIKHLPQVVNLHGVGHAKYKATAASPSAAKVKVMRDVLDEISAQPLEDDAPPVLSQNGKSKKPLHLWGFSDDDWGNFDAAVKALSEDVKAGKYANVKITVFYTGKNNPRHEAGAWVLTPEGELRPVTTDEHGEAYILHLEKPGEFKKPAFQALPYPTVVRSPLATADAAFERVFVSNPSPAQHDLLVSGDDLLARERDAITAFIDNGAPADLKRIVLTRYSINDAALAKELARAKRLGIDVVLITDLNVSMDFAFAEGESMIADFSRAKPKDDAAGRFIQLLLDGGFRIGVDIVSQPLYNHGDSMRDPLMHEKSLLLVTKADPKRGVEGATQVVRDPLLEMYFGTANLATNPRYNRIFKVIEPQLAAHALAHAEAMIEAFKAGKPIKEIESEPPFRVYFEDDSFVELAYTNGKYNPNERLVDLFERAAQDPKDVKIEGVVFSHFVMTNGQVIDTLKDAMKAQEDFEVIAVVDDKFIPVRGYGKAANLAGVPAVPEMGKISFGFGYSLRKRIKAWAYQRRAVGADGKPIEEKGLEGPPLARHLWHDKTTIVYVVENGVRWAYVFTGSFNNSNNFHSAELQIMGRFRADSPMVAAIRDSIVKTAESERDHAVWLDRALLRHTLARLIGHSPLEISLAGLRAITDAMKGDVSGVGRELTKALAAGTSLVQDTIAPELARANIARFMELLNWYGGAKKPPLNMQRAIAAAAVLAYPDMSAYEKKVLINSFLWEDIPDSEMERQTGEAWRALGLKDEMPARKERS
ncbi:MAG: hypothetical protein HY553_12110 [Elusimicrobia bacterium]|nr:hypothetical protein [Elusimicrobiota bacterium]